MSHLITHRGTVYPWQCDHNGHINVIWYVGKFDEATWCLFADIGITRDYLRDAHRGMVAVEQQLFYKRELFAGDTLVIESRVVDVGAKFLRFEHTMRKNGEEAIAASTALVGVHIDAGSRRACPFPERLQEAMGAVLAGGGRPIVGSASGGQGSFSRTVGSEFVLPACQAGFHELISTGSAMMPEASST